MGADHFIGKGLPKERDSPLQDGRRISRRTEERLISRGKTDLGSREGNVVIFSNAPSEEGGSYTLVQRHFRKRSTEQKDSHSRERLLLLKLITCLHYQRASGSRSESFRRSVLSEEIITEQCGTTEGR